MIRNQILASGLVIRQDFSDAVRAVFFQTELEDFLYATHGGSMFLVNFRGRFYGLTCKHVFGDFDASTIFITQEKHAKKGNMPAPVEGLYFPSAPVGDAAGSDVGDICVIRFADDIAPGFFGSSPFVFDEKTIGTSSVGHELHVSGVLKDKSEIIPPDITMGYCHLVLHDVGVRTSDPFLRQATARFSNPEFDNIVGISGSPVFDHTANVLCGMAARGGMTGNECILYYIDIFDIARVLEGISVGASGASYTKMFPQLRPNRVP
jgi:hypothetical protein